MVQAWNESGTGFAYLHTASDDVAMPHTLNSSNERLHQTIGNVESSFHDTRVILEAFLTRWLNHAS
jgi:hypothetical protein